MESENPTIPWTEEQWNMVQETIREEARKVRIAASFLPIYGPLTAETEAVTLQKVKEEDTAEKGPFSALAETLGDAAKVEEIKLPELFRKLADDVTEVQHMASRRRGESKERLLVDDTITRPLTRISVNVYLTTGQIHQPDLSSALIMFRRAANLIARVEDRLVFNGQPDNPSPDNLKVKPSIYRVSGGAAFLGLIQEAEGIEAETESIEGETEGKKDEKKKPNEITLGGEPEKQGQELVTAVADGISRLESYGHLSPFALILGRKLFVTAHTPDKNSLVLPADRIKPLLDGPLLRSSTIPEHQGVLVSLASDLVDLVIAKDMSAKYLQATLEPRYVFRVSERITLRVKQPRAIIAFSLNSESKSPNTSKTRSTSKSRATTRPTKRRS